MEEKKWETTEELRGERRIQRGGQEELEALSYECVFLFSTAYFQADNTLHEDKDLITSTAIICKFA